MASSWSSLSNLPSLTNGFNPDTMILLTDGSVLVHNSQGANGGKEWFRLTPDDRGHYDTGKWSGALNMTNTRIFFASGVLMDGRVFVVGGEFSDAGGDTPLGEIFDPSTNLWGPMNKPANFNFIQGDCSACVLADGRVIFGDINSQRSAIWDPVIDQWTESGFQFGTTNVQSKQGKTNEETWTLLPDGTVLAVETFNPNAAEKYLPSQDRWVTAGNTKAALPITTINDPLNSNLPVNVFEIGPAVVLPNGKLFAIGGTGHTGLYTPPSNDPTQTGTWDNGPDFPADTSGNNFSAILTCSDGAAVVLPGGKVLCMAGSLYRFSAPGLVDFFSNPTTFFLFDPANTNSLPQFNPQPGSHSNDTWTARLLLLPNGDVFFTDEQNRIQMLTPDASLLTPDPAWKPVITNAPATLNPGHTYVISGRQLNGLTQANSYGDDAQMATNFPLVRLTNTSTNKVHYLPTSNFSTLGIATGNTVVTTDVHVPPKMPTGQYNLVVIANAIASDPQTVNVAAQDLFLIIDRSTFGQGEIQALINLNGAPAVIDPAVYVVVEGFSPNDLGLNSGNLSSPPNKPAFVNPDPKISLEFSGAVIPQDPALHPATAQRFTFPFKTNFQDDSMFNFPNPSETLAIVASLSAGGRTIAGGGVIQLIKNPNPFILHGDVAHGYDWYLSVDIRVFQLKAGDTHFAAHVATSGSARTVATTFIQQAIHNLNSSPGSASGEFDALPEGEDTSTLALASTDSHGTPVYNFALARVRYRDIQDASNVRLFFRMWPAQQTNATYDTNTTYRSGSNGLGHLIPLLGVQGDEVITIPFFASPRIDATTSNMKTQPDTPNVAPVIHPDALGGEVDTYFGAWLDINQPGEKLFPARMLGNLPQNLPDGPFVNMGPLLSIMELVRSEHQCLLAEISFDPDPIPSTADPSTSDKLAQRNLTFVNVPNPGFAASRRAPQTFEVRPTPIQLPAALGSDELMIEWGNTPTGSLADIFLPAVPAAQIIDLANQIYSDHRLKQVEANTIQCPTGGVTYIPVPRAAGPNFASLLTINLPETVKKGQVYNISVKQITSAAGAARLGLNRDGQVQQGKTQAATRRGATASRAAPAFQEGAFISKDRFFDIFWRRVLGKFQLTIPVSTKQELLSTEERRLSILRFIEKSIPVDNRWFKVYRRYVEQTGERVRFMGGDPDQVKADPNGDWDGTIRGHGHEHEHEHEHEYEHEHEHEYEHEHRKGGEERQEFSGKISGLFYDRFADFEGFLLDTEDGERRFFSREKAMEALVVEAWEDRLFVSVIVEHYALKRPMAIILRGGKEE